MNNIELQRNYYETNLDKPAMQPSSSIYVTRHLDHVIRLGKLSPEKSLVEIGSGLGKFTIPLLERGYTPTCLDISPLMLEQIQKHALPYKVSTVLSDIANASSNTEQKFEQAVGFFTLHHMSDLKQSLQGLSDILIPGGKAIFCEPRAYNPLYYIQITMTPRMSWKAEKGIINMRKNYLLSALEDSDLELIEVFSYGFFPPFIMNTTWGTQLNDLLEKQSWLSFGHAFQIFAIQKKSN